MRWLGLLAFPVSLILAGCVTMNQPVPIQQPIERSRTYSDSFDAVWLRLVRDLPAHNINIKTMDKQSGIIYAETTVVNPAIGNNTQSRQLIKTIADCRHLDYESNYTDLTIKYNFVVTGDKKTTTVHVNIQYSQIEVNDDGRQSGNISCQTRGVEEKSILDSINK